ncbi:DUF5067 domain-containing protein [Gemella morbillorum]|uniref:DUF5067 domain-containing protein n=1 Tax=Gemella morbillorum TaxID=29391 RepID=UPI00319E7D1E
MKSKKLLIALITFSLLISGCSSMKEEKKENPVTNETDKNKVNSSSRDGEYTFKDGKVSMEDIDIKITKYKVIPVGEEGNEYGENPVIAFWYDTTNKSGKDIINPMSAWFAAFPEGPIQDNDKNKVNKLKVAGHPDKTLLNDQSATIKKDGTLSGAVAYELTDLTTPVKLTAYKGVGGIELGSQEFAVK